MEQGKTRRMDVYLAMNRLWLFLGLFALCGLASVFKSSGVLVSQLAQLEWSVGGDKALHFLFASVLSVCSVWVTAPLQRKCFGLVGWPTLLLLVAVVVDELSQYYLPRREFSFSDMAVNISGVVAGVALFTLLRSVFSLLRAN
jgi:VanZ family protein